MIATNQAAHDPTARVAHTSGVLVALFQCDEFFETRNRHPANGSEESSRRWNIVARTRDACVTGSTCA